MPKLQISFHDGTEVSHELTESPISIGRLPENSIEVADASVSSRHAELTVGDSDYVITDIGSTNGTRLNGRKLAVNEAHPLQDGDEIFFGSVQGVYVSENPANASPMPDAASALAVAAEASVRPADFENASPFQTKSDKMAGSAVAVLALGVVAILGFAVTMALVFTMNVPL